MNPSILLAQDKIQGDAEINEPNEIDYPEDPFPESEEMWSSLDILRRNVLNT